MTLIRRGNASGLVRSNLASAFVILLRIQGQQKIYEKEGSFMYSIIVAVFMIETRRRTWDKLVLATMPQLSVMVGTFDESERNTVPGCKRCYLCI
jgi:hypothetical protein